MEQTIRLVASQTPDSGTRPAEVVVRDGSTVRVRLLQGDDGPRVYDFLRALSERSLALRFHGMLSDESLRREAIRLAQASTDGTVALVATTGPEERIVGHAMYAPIGSGRAEVALAVADPVQGHGLGTLLLGQLAQLASGRGISTFTASALPQNQQMLGVFRDTGFPTRFEVRSGEVRVELLTEVTPEAVERFEERDRTAAANAVRAVLHPRSVAVIGASRRRGTIAAEVFRNLLDFGFDGPVIPVNPNAAVVQSVVAYASVGAVPGPVDLAVIVVPAARVLEAAEECGRKGVKGLVVISAGFAEAGEAGRTRQEELVRVCRIYGMRLVGPNCMGILNTDPAVRLNATFAPGIPTPGRLGFMSQSGALGLSVLDFARTLGLGLSTFVSVGNKADLSGNDLLEYWDDDPSTDAILLYLESFGNPRKFSRIARRVARKKPIIVVKSGRSTAGVRAAGSHTGAILASSDLTVDALFRQAGVIRTDTLSEMFDVAALLSRQPVPSGRGVAIVTNAGGPGILCADLCDAEGLEIPLLTEETRTKLRAVLPPAASLANPVDLIASATGEQYREAIQIVGADPAVDAVIAIFVPRLVTPTAEVARAMVEGARAFGQRKPLLPVFIQSEATPVELSGSDLPLPAFRFPEDAVTALARSSRYGEWLGRLPAPPPRFTDARPQEAIALASRAVERGGGWLSPDETVAILSCFGLRVVEQRSAESAEAAGRVAEELGGRVALKGVAQGLLHRSDVNAVRLDLEPAAVRAAALEVEAALRGGGYAPGGFIVQRMAARGAEMIVGVAHDPRFGPLVACGSGGVLVELLRDVSVRLTPLSKDDAREMVMELKASPLLTGYRGSPPCDVAALTEVILRVAALVEAVPQIAELDLNPVLVHETGASIVDARVRVAPAPGPPPFGSR